MQQIENPPAIQPSNNPAIQPSNSSITSSRSNSCHLMQRSEPRRRWKLSKNAPQTARHWGKSMETKNRESIINSKVFNNIYTNVLGPDLTAAGYSIVGSHDSKRDIARPLHATSSGSISATKPKTENQNENGKLTGVAFGKSGEDQPQKCAP